MAKFRVAYITPGVENAQGGAKARRKIFGGVGVGVRAYSEQYSI